MHGAFYSFVAPTPTGTEPRTVLASPDVARLIGLEPAELERPEFALVFSGNVPLPGTKGRSYAQCYGGHQFGSWAGAAGLCAPGACFPALRRAAGAVGCAGGCWLPGLVCGGEVWRLPK